MLKNLKMLQDFKTVAKAWFSPSMNLNILNLPQLLAIALSFTMANLD
jgi:hypothetical protein